jgi:dynein light intermediate chain, axonemal
MLLRIRDEIKMTICAYQTLYQSSVTFAMRKQLQAENGKSDLENRITLLTSQRQKQENQVVELRARKDAIEKRNSERREVERKKREEEIKFLDY